MKTIIIAFTIAIIAGLVYQKVVVEDASFEQTITSFKNAVSQKENNMDIDKNTINEKILNLALETNSMVNNITCDNAVSIYENYIAKNKAKDSSEEYIYKMLDKISQYKNSETLMKETITTVFCTK